MLLASAWPAAQDEPRGRPIVYATQVEGAHPSRVAEYIGQALDEADGADADLIVFMLRTPGGLVDSTREINTRIIEAETPVVVYVAPSGTRAASAGFLITIAADVAAMAPARTSAPRIRSPAPGPKWTEGRVGEGRLRRGGVRAVACEPAAAQRGIGGEGG